MARVGAAEVFILEYRGRSQRVKRAARHDFTGSLLGKQKSARLKHRLAIRIERKPVSDAEEATVCEESRLLRVRDIELPVCELKNHALVGGLRRAAGPAEG